jgi:short-subunit dehydrogenase
MSNVWIVGATSSLGKVLAKQHASVGDSLILSGRSVEELESLARDLNIRYQVDVMALVMDFADKTLEMESLLQKTTEVDVMYMLVGDMGEGDFDNSQLIERVLHVNFVQPAKWLSVVASAFKKQKHGTIVVVGSVAGDRGRASNYPYGSAKGGVALFADGLRGALVASGVHVLTVKLGYTDTPMTYGKVDKLVASREYVARKIRQAVRKKKDIIYMPFFWRYIMMIIKAIPERLFKHLKL